MYIKKNKKLLNILVIYSCSTFPLRSTTWNHLYSFHKYSGHKCFYLNISVQDLSPYIWKIPFDLIVFDTLFMSSRWNREMFLRSVEKVQSLKKLEAVKIALPQDEFISTDILSDAINEMEVDWVFSVAPPSEWPKIYSTVNFNKVRFDQVLTGYLDEKFLNIIARIARKTKNRPIDIGYRTAGRPYPWFGRHGYLKEWIAEAFQKHAPSKELTIDISTDGKNTILGDKWYKFLLSCKYTIGVEGGTSIIDRDGSIHESTTRYMARNPKANFEEIEANCFPKLDGTAAIFSLSPRHLEACATKTCQILTSGHYNGILEPSRHYIELKHDFSNIDDVIEVISDDLLRKEITERAYSEIVESGKYTYREFIRFVIERSLSIR